MKVIFNITENKNKATFQQEVVKINTSFNQTSNVVIPKFQTGYYPLPSNIDLSNYYTKQEVIDNFKPITYNPDIEEVLTNGNITSKTAIFQSSNIEFFWQNNISAYGAFIQKTNIGSNEVEEIVFDYRGINSSDSNGTTSVGFAAKTKTANIIFPNESGTVVLNYQLNDFYKKTETLSKNQINTSLGLKLDKGGYEGTAQDLYDRFEGKIEASINNIPKGGNGDSGKVLVNSIITEIYGKIGVGLAVEASEKLEVNGRIKSDGIVINETTSAILPKEIKFKDGKFKAALADGVEKSILLEGESNLLFSYTHTSNISLQPTSVNYSTGYITVNNHGLSFSGQKLIGLFNNGFSLSDPISNLKYNAPEEWLSSNLYIKIIDANTLMICNSSGGLISASIGTGNNKNLDVSKWHIEIIDTSTKPCVINDLNNCRIEIRGVAFAGNVAVALRQISFQNNVGNQLLIEFGQFAGVNTKQNILFNAFVNTFFKGRYRNAVGFENSKHLLYGSPNYGYNQTVYAPSIQMINSSNNHNITSLSHNFLGNGSTIEIYKS